MSSSSVIDGTDAVSAAVMLAEPQSFIQNDRWAAAFAKLSADNRSKLDHGQANRATIMQDLLKVLNQKQELCLDKRWKYVNSRGQTVIVRDFFEKMSYYVKKFVEVVDVAVQYDPGHAALPWAGVRFLLQLVINATNLQAIMAESLEKVSEMITRYAIVESMFLNTSSAIRAPLEAQISNLYFAILECIIKMSRYFGQSTTEALLKNPFKNFEKEMFPYISGITRRDDEIQALLQLHHHEDQTKLLAASEETSSSVESLAQSIGGMHLDISRELTLARKQGVSNQAASERQLESLVKINDDLRGPLQRLSFQAHQVEDRLTERQRLEILLWLSKVAYRKNHSNMSGDLLPGSCVWLERHSVFQQWINSSVSSVLWLHGIPGFGKSKLVAHTIQLFLKQAQLQTTTAPVAFFYCIRATAEPERANPEEIMRALLKQLAKARTDSPLRSSVVAKFEHARQEAMEDGSVLVPLTIDECVSLILEILENTSAIIIIDALDECDASRRHELLRALKKIVAEAANLVKVFISSRNHSDIVIKLADVPNIYIASTDNYRDIKNFTVARVDEAIEDQRLLNGNVSASLRDEIISALAERAKGMFLWASLQIQNICDFERIQLAEDLRNELGKVPRNLQQLYESAIDQINAKGSRARASALKALRWILVAEQPLSCEALVQAVNEATGADLVIPDIVSLCSNLIVLDGQSNVFRFAHLSVREYLESREDFSPSSVHQEIALQCLRSCYTILKQDGPYCQDFDGRGYLDYTFLYWPVHCFFTQREPGSPVLEALCILLEDYESNTSRYTTWMQVVSSLKRKRIAERWRLWLRLALSRPSEPIFLLITFNLDFILEQLPRIVENSLDSINSVGLSPLALACNLGRSHAVKVLLAKGTVVNIGNGVFHDYSLTDDPWPCNPLSAAVRGKHTGLVNILLNEGALVKVKRDWYNPLSLAAASGDQDVVKILIQKVADTDPQSDSSYLSDPLRRAAAVGDKEICGLLLDQGANPNDLEVDDDNLGPLELAAKHGHIHVVRLLVERGACVDRSMSHSGSTSHAETALACAALEGFTGIVEYLLQEHANPNLETGHDGSPFLLAVDKGDAAIVELMLAYGADINTPGTGMGHALAIATRRQKHALVSLLLEHGANIRQPFLHIGEAFNNLPEFIASSGSLEQLKQIMGTAMAHPTKSDINGLFIAAVLGGSEDRRRISTWLLEAGADVNTEREVSALHVAAHGLELGLTCELLSHGAHIDAMVDTSGYISGSILQTLLVRHPLLLNCKGCNRESRAGNDGLFAIFVLLIEAGIDINAVGGQLGDAIQAAASHGRYQEIEQLLNLGATVHVDKGKYGSALHAAAACGHPLSTIALLKSHTDLNTICEPYGTSLQAVSCRGRLPASEYLKKCPQQRDSYSREFWESYDHQASYFEDHDFQKTFDMLISAGASVNSRGVRFDTALQAAAYVGDENFVEKLLLAGAEVQARGGVYDNCLQAVAAGEADEWWKRPDYHGSEASVVFAEEEQPAPDHHANVLNTLLATDARAFMNEVGGFFGTCLQAAAHSNNPTLVKMLLDAGAIVTEDGNGFNGGCVSAAIGFGKCGLIVGSRESWELWDGNEAEILRLLLEHTSAARYNQVCKTAFDRAIQDGNKMGIELLREFVPEVALNTTVEDAEDSDHKHGRANILGSKHMSEIKKHARQRMEQLQIAAMQMIRQHDQNPEKYDDAEANEQYGDRDLLMMHLQRTLERVQEAVIDKDDILEEIDSLIGQEHFTPLD